MPFGKFTCMNIVDSHSHIWTPDLAHYPLAPGFKQEDMSPPSWTPEELLSHGRPEGVQRVVLIQMSFYRYDNSYMLHCLREHPGVFSGVAVIDVAAERPDREMERLSKHGVRGFRFYPVDGPIENWIETPGYERMFRCAADHHLAICPLIDPRALPSLPRMCEQHPKTTVVIDHFCHNKHNGENQKTNNNSLCAMARFPEVRLKVSAFYALGKKKPPHEDLEPMIRHVYAAFGPERLMWGSDCPFAVVSETYRDSLALVRDGCRWLSAPDREWLLGKTAERVFFR